MFHHLLLVDEINRATPKTQAALLETMQERAVTASGERFALPAPFFVLATQNPLEMEGTYPLPEAQLDRFFFKLHVPFPAVEELVEISRRTTRFSEPQLTVVLEGEKLIDFQELLTHVPVAEPLLLYAARLVLATHPHGDAAANGVARYLSYGASPRRHAGHGPRGAVYCLLDGRTAVSLEDIRRSACPALRHRLILNFEGEAEQVNVDELIRGVLQRIPTPDQEGA